MQLADWLAHQQAQHPKTIELGLERVREVAARLALLPWPIPTIIIGGTNGKGSTSAFLTALARAAGLRVGTYTSPHLQRYNERIAIDDVPVDDATLVSAFERIEQAREGVTLTFFEYGTLAALEIFKSQRIDVALLEVGLGGQLDATNIVEADVAVLCSIGLDHQDWLGPTVEHIGREKAGIFRAGKPVILGSAAMPASVHAALAELRCIAHWIDADFWAEPEGDQGHWRWRGRAQVFESLPPPALQGPIQPRNAATAIAAFLELLKTRLPQAPPIDASIVSQALRTVRLRGRFQRLPPRQAGEPEWILDVAHNEDSARMLAESLRGLPRAQRTVGVVGVLGDKDADGILRQVNGLIDQWVLCGLEGARGGTPESLRARLPAELPCVALAPDVAHGCATARALTGAQDRIVVFGSFHVVGPALDWLGI